MKKISFGNKEIECEYYTLEELGVDKEKVFISREIDYQYMMEIIGVVHPDSKEAQLPGLLWCPKSNCFYAFEVQKEVEMESYIDNLDPISRMAFIEAVTPPLCMYEVWFVGFDENGGRLDTLGLPQQPTLEQILKSKPTR